MATKTISFVKTNKLFFVAFGFIFSTNFLWWLAFYPGILTYDSLDQWLQATSGSFNNWHPYFYAFVLSLLIKIWHTPAVMALVQILLFSTVVASFLNLINKNNPKGKLLLILAIIFFCTFPAFGILNITLWKDILFSIVVLSGGLFLYYFLLTKSRIAIYLFFVSMGLSAVIRHNGFIFLALMPALLLFFKKIKKEQLYFGVFLSLFVFIFFNYFLFNIFQVNRTSLPKEQFNIKLVAAAYHFDRGIFNDQDKKIMASLQPLEFWDQKYSCASVDALTFNPYVGKNIHELEASPIKNKKLLEDWHGLVSKVIKKSSISVIKDRACYTPHLLLSQSLYADHIPGDGIPRIYEQSKSLKLKVFMKKVLAKSTEIPFRYIFWNGAIWALIAILGIYYGLKNKNEALTIYSFYSIITLPSVILLAPASDFRYIYPMVLTTIFIPLIYKKSKKSKS